MGSLKPNVTYIYEKSNGVTYAREFGSLERKAIGWDFPMLQEPKFQHSDVQEVQLWSEIRQSAKTNIALQKALDRVKLLYQLSKENVRKT
jgi:hypothetical protein